MNRLLTQRLDEDSAFAGREAQYLLRSSIGHLWELALCVRGWNQSSAVAELLNRLDDDKRRKIDTLLAVAQPGSDPVAKTIAHLRNVATWHYTAPGKAKHLQWALGEVKEMEGSIEFGETYDLYRACYVDEVLVQLSHQLLDGDEEAALRLLMERLSTLTVDAIQVLDALCGAYFTEVRGCVVEAR